MLIQLLGMRGSIPARAPSTLFHPAGGAGKHLLGAKTPFLGPAPLPNPAFGETVPTPQRTRLVCVPRCPQSHVYVLPCSQFAPNQLVLPQSRARPPRPAAAPGENQAGRRAEKCPAAMLPPRVSPRPHPGRVWEPGGTAQLWGVPLIQPPVGWMGCRLGWMCSSWLCFRGVLWGAGRQEGTGWLHVVSPPGRGSCHRVWDSSLWGSCRSGAPTLGWIPAGGGYPDLGTEGRGGQGDTRVWESLSQGGPDAGTGHTQTHGQTDTWTQPQHRAHTQPLTPETAPVPWDSTQDPHPCHNCPGLSSQLPTCISHSPRVLQEGF